MAAAFAVLAAAGPASAFTFDSHTNQSGVAAALSQQSDDDGTVHFGGGSMHFSVSGAGSDGGGSSPFLPSHDSKFYSPYDPAASSGFSPYYQR